MSTNTSTAAPGSHSNPTRHIKSIDNDMYCRAEEKEFEEECYLMPQALVEDHFDEAHDDLDADYDPKDDTLQGIKDAEEDEEDKKEEEPELIAKSGDTDNEECVVHADEFEKEFNEAIENVLRVAQMDREAILSNVRKEYERETGQEPTDQMIADAFKTFNICGTEETQNDADDEACDVDPQQFGKEFEKALQIVREVAKVDQELLVNAICNIYNDLCDEEPDAKQLSEIFGAVKEELADEAREEFVELYQVVEDDDSDSDYDEEEEEEESSSSSSEQTSHSESNEEEEEATADDEIDINTTQFRTEFEEALAVVRDVAKLDQELLVNGICNIYNDLAEEEPDVTQLQEIFGAVKDELADEAKQQFVVKILDEDEKESDSDYVLQNEEEEEEEESESEFEASEPDIFEDNLLEESDDGDYDPKQDESQGMMDEEEDLFDESSLSQEDEEEEELQLNEEEMIETEAFEKEWNAAIDNVCFVAQRDRQTMLNNVRWQFEQETGEEATNEMMTDAIKTFEICDDEGDALCDIDSDEFRKEFEEALLVVRDVAKVDQARLVNTICDISSDLCDREPDVTQMSQIFDRIKESLADEARDEFLDLYETCVDHEDSDSDYDVRFDLNDCEESERGEFEWEKDNEDGMFNIGGFIDYSAAQSDVDCATEEEEEEEIDLDSTEFRKEFEEALDVVRDVAKVDQELLVNSICNMCNDLADEEPDPQQLSEIFGAVKEGLAEEARESEVDDEDSDSDYDVDEDEMNDSETESEEFNWSESDASQSDIAEDESLTSDDDEDAIAQGFNIGGVDDEEALIDIEEVVEVEDALDYVDSDAFRKEFDEALQIVRDVAKVDQELLVNGICNIYNDLCDEEPDAKQLSLIFDAVKDGLAEEATQQLDDAEETEETDSDYDVAADDISSEEEEEETDEEEAEEEEEKLELESDEEIDIKSEEFRKEFEEALQVTRDVAKLDQELLVNGICNFYKDLCDQEPDLKQLTEIFGAVKEGLAEEATEQVDDEDSDSDYVDEDETNDSETESEEYNMWSESEASQSDIVEDESLEFEEEEEEEIDIESPEFEKEFSEALQSVRDAAKLDQELLVNGICNLYNDLRDEEPNAQQLSNIFGAVKAELADEATKQFVDSDEEDKENKDSDYDVAEDEANETDSEEYNWSESDESDEDYDPKEDQEQGTKDAEEDLFDESESDAKSEEDQ